MAELFVRNSLNSRKVVKFNISIEEYALKGEEGDSKWVLVIGTMHLDSTGGKIPPVIIHNITESTVLSEVSKSIEDMCALIDWEILEEDNEPPYIEYFYPKGLNTPIKSKIVISVKEYLPASGIDLSDIKVILNNGEVDFDITSELNIKGDPYNYVLEWLPPNLTG